MADGNNDIEKYLRGELTPAEMHALEKKALNDTFLADALAGAETVQPNDFSADIRKLNGLLDERIHVKDRRKIIPLWTLVGRIAAGLLVLVVSGYIVFSLLNNKVKPTELALNKSEVQSPVQSRAEKKEPAPLVNSTVENVVTKEAEKPKPAPSHTSPPVAVVEKQQEAEHQPSSSEKKEVMQGPTPKREADVAEEIVEVNKKSDLEEVEVQKDVTLAAPVPEEKFDVKDKRAKRVERTEDSRAYGFATSSGMKSEDKKITAKIVRGTVTDAEDGSPLPGVNVLIKGSSAGVVTDAEGNYQIPLENKNAELVFSFIGMQAVDVPVDNKDNIDVKMDQDVSQLSEVVVVGYISKNDEITKETEPNIYQLAEPAGGRKAFKKYLVDNLQYPELAIENKIQGKVTIQFTVEKSGTVNDFKVLKGIGFGCDEEVIRLVRQGPKWTPTKRNDEPLKGKVKVRLRFQLPE